mmetsp:Transcript_27080/g.33445  ORF Transcript_27080/g.33445 Transcript_27080/m.33445 type:complete len:80 (-) Transcript_27080:543-782(-)
MYTFPPPSAQDSSIIYFCSNVLVRTVRGQSIFDGFYKISGTSLSSSLSAISNGLSALPPAPNKCAFTAYDLGISSKPLL